MRSRTLGVLSGNVASRANHATPSAAVPQARVTTENAKPAMK